MSKNKLVRNVDKVKCVIKTRILYLKQFNDIYALLDTCRAYGIITCPFLHLFLSLHITLQQFNSIEHDMTISPWGQLHSVLSCFKYVHDSRVQNPVAARS
jgi:hypothetical protein